MLTAFTAGLLLITISELGDKTFFMAMILAMRHSRRLVLSAVIAALAAMTILSVSIGKVMTLIPTHYLHWVELALFFGFGFKMLYDASQMSAESTADVVKEAEAEVNREEPMAQRWWNIFQRYPQIVTWLQAFSLTFIAEWGDRTQVSTIVLAASNDALGVTLGAIVGHSICALIAVVGGRLIAGKISERVVTMIGGVLFLIFGLVAAIQGPTA